MPSTSTATCGQVLGTIGGTQDIVQYKNGDEAKPVSWIDYQGFPQGNLAKSPQIQTVRTPYSITQANLNSGFANIPVTFPVPFADNKYTLAQAIGHTAPLDNGNDYSPGDNHLLAAEGFTAQIYVNGTIAQVGDAIVLNTIAIHD